MSEEGKGEGVQVRGGLEEGVEDLSLGCFGEGGDGGDWGQGCHDFGFLRFGVWSSWFGVSSFRE